MLYQHAVDGLLCILAKCYGLLGNKNEKKTDNEQPITIQRTHIEFVCAFIRGMKCFVLCYARCATSFVYILGILGIGKLLTGNTGHR